MCQSSPIFCTFFQVPYPGTPLIGTLTKTAGMCTNNSRSGPPRVALHEGNKLIPLLRPCQGTKPGCHLYSSPFLSHSCALLGTPKPNSFTFNRFRTLCAKTPGVGGGPPC